MGDSNELIKTKSRIFNLSASSFTSSYNDTMLSSGSFTIPNFIKHNENINHIYFMVSHAEVPNSFYLINQYNNILYINSITYDIPYGNYNTSSLITTLLNILPSSYTITFNSIYQKLTFSNTIPFTISYLNSSISRVMGLSRTSDMVSVLSSSLYNITLPNCVNFLPTARINFRSRNLQLENYQANDNSSDVFLSLQNNASQNGLITYSNNNALKYHIDLESLNQIEIRVTDDSNRELDFNGVSWFITLRIDYEYKVLIPTNSFSKIIKNNNEFLLKYLNYINE